MALPCLNIRVVSSRPIFNGAWWGGKNGLNSLRERNIGEKFRIQTLALTLEKKKKKKRHDMVVPPQIKFLTRGFLSFIYFLFLVLS